MLERALAATPEMVAAQVRRLGENEASTEAIPKIKRADLCMHFIQQTLQLIAKCGWQPEEMLNHLARDVSQEWATIERVIQVAKRLQCNRHPKGGCRLMVELASKMWSQLVRAHSPEITDQDASRLFESMGIAEEPEAGATGSGDSFERDEKRYRELCSKKISAQIEFAAGKQFGGMQPHDSFFPASVF